jgi:hypothetical protein
MKLDEARWGSLMRFAHSTLGLIAAGLGVSLFFGAGCSSKSSSGPAATPDPDTGTVPEDTTPAEDTTPPPWATYPDGPYDFKLGSVIPNLGFSGYRDAKGDWVSDIQLIDYYDPDGTRPNTDGGIGINGIYLVVSAQWCGPCNTEGDILPGLYSSNYKARGARFITAITESTGNTPAVQATVDWWIKKHSINFDMVLDDTWSTYPDWTAHKAGAGIPHSYVINPRDMKIYRIVTGVAPGMTKIAALDALLKVNGAPPAPTPDTGTDTATDPDTGTDAATD